jgi:hypothetical protein
LIPKPARKGNFKEKPSRKTSIILGHTPESPKKRRDFQRFAPIIFCQVAGSTLHSAIEMLAIGWIF